MSESIECWFFAPLDRKLRHGDGRAIVLGETHTVEGELALCHNGLHGSVRAIDALRLGGGPIVYRTRHTGNIVRSTDKLCSRSRTYVSGGIDATQTLIEFACCVAEAAMLMAEWYDPRSWEAIEATRAFQRGEIDRATLNAAYAAANAAAYAAYAYAYAAEAAAYAAANAAANAYAAYHAAAYAYAAEAAAYAAEAEINAILESMLTEAM